MADRTCSVEGCRKPHRARGLCASHYMVAYNRANPYKPAPGTRCMGAVGVRHRAGRITCGPECSAAFNTTTSREWAQRNYEEKVKPQARHTQARRRARLRGAAYVEDVDVLVLACRDGYRCHLCGKRVEMTLKCPDRMSPVRDHLVPVSLGGEHSYANTKLAHLGCNSRKNVKPMGEQLLLIG